MTVKDLYIACQNISLNSTFNLYGNQFTFSESIKPLFTVTYSEMNEATRNTTVIRFRINEAEDTVECLIL